MTTSFAGRAGLSGVARPVGTLIVTARLGRRGPALYDPAVTDGKILVGVIDPPPATRSAVERALTAAGHVELRRS